MKKIIALSLLSALTQVYANDGFLTIKNATGGWIYIDTHAGTNCGRSLICTWTYDKGNGTDGKVTKNSNLAPGKTATFHAVTLPTNSIVGMNIYRCQSYSSSNDDCKRGQQLTHLEAATNKNIFRKSDDSDTTRHNPDIEYNFKHVEISDLWLGGDYYPGLSYSPRAEGHDTGVTVTLAPPNLKTFRNVPIEAATVDDASSKSFSTGTGDFVLNRGHAILSSPDKNGNVYELIMQSDNNLVLYHCKPVIGTDHINSKNGCLLGKPVWYSGTNGKPGVAAARLQQSDGHFLIYSNGSPLWTTNKYSADYKNNALLRLQSDGNLVIAKASDNSLIWASGTNGKQ